VTDPDDALEYLPPDPAEAEVDPADALDRAVPLEADPADVADQQQSVDGFDEDYPGS